MVSKECVKAKEINGFSMRDVAHSSGLALGTIYNYLIDKETMIIETLVSIWKDYITSIPSTDSFMDYLLSVTNIMDEIESTYPNFINTHPRHISDYKVIIAKKWWIENCKTSRIRSSLQSIEIRRIRENLFNYLLTKENLARFNIKNILSLKLKRIKNY